VDDMGTKLVENSKAFDKKISQLNDRVVAGQRDLQGQLLDQSKQLMEAIRSNHDDLSAALQQAVEELRSDKTDRVTLANLLTEVAMRLKEEFDIPGIE